MKADRKRRPSAARLLSAVAAVGIALGACTATDQGDATGSGGAMTGGAGSGGGAPGGGGAAGAGTAGSAGAAGATGGAGIAGAGVGAGGSGGASTAGAGAGGSGGAGTAGTGAGGSGGAGTAGAGAGGSGGAGGGGTAGTGGRGNTAGAGGLGAGGATAGASGSAAGPFTCSQVTGGKLTEEWFIAGFEKVVDNARWQVKWREDGYVEEWANPQSSFWTAPVDSACARDTTSPDRIVFGAVTWKYTTQAAFRTALTQAVNTFKAKYPNLRRIDFVTQIRGPNNMSCPTPATAGESIAVPAIQDAAMEEVAAAFPGFVFVGPEVEAHACSEFQGGGPHLTAAGNMANVKGFSDYFVQVQ